MSPPHREESELLADLASLLGVLGDRAACSHLALALGGHRRKHGPRVPVGLLDLERRASRIARGRGQKRTPERPSADIPADPVVGSAYNRRDDIGSLCTQKQAAAMLGRSSRTVRRWLDRGRLQSVAVAGVRRVPRAEVMREIERLSELGGPNDR